MRQLRESYKNVFLSPQCDDNALDYLLYVVELEKKYTASQLCLAIERNNKNGVLCMDAQTRYLFDTYQGFFLAKFFLSLSIKFEELHPSEIYSFVNNYRARSIPEHSFYDGGII